MSTEKKTLKEEESSVKSAEDFTEEVQEKKRQKLKIFDKESTDKKSQKEESKEGEMVNIALSVL